MLLTLIALLALGAPSDDDLSPTLNAFTAYEEGRELFVAVDARAARLMKDGDMFPLAIGLANSGRRSVTFHVESFTIETEAGVAHPTVAYEEYRRDYSRSKADRRVGDLFFETMLGRFSNFRHSSWRPFPVAGGGTVQSSVELGRNAWTIAYLYFPVPDGGIRDRVLTLLVDTPESDGPMYVRFRIE